MADKSIFDRLRELDIPTGHYAVFGSGPLLVRDIIDDVHDLDVLTRGPAWTYVQSLGPVVVDAAFGENLVELADGLLTFGTKWGIGEVDTDELIDSAELIEGIPFARLSYVEEYKRTVGRPKDLSHLERLRIWREGSTG